MGAWAGLDYGAGMQNEGDTSLKTGKSRLLVRLRATVYLPHSCSPSLAHPQYLTFYSRALTRSLSLSLTPTHSDSCSHSHSHSHSLILTPPLPPPPAQVIHSEAACEARTHKALSAAAACRALNSQIKVSALRVWAHGCVGACAHMQVLMWSGWLSGCFRLTNCPLAWALGRRTYRGGRGCDQAQTPQHVPSTAPHGTTQHSTTHSVPDPPVHVLPTLFLAHTGVPRSLITPV